MNVKKHLNKVLWTAAGVTVFFIIGCGGGGNGLSTTGGATGGATGGSTGNATGGSSLSVAAPSFQTGAAEVQVQFLSGQGRAAGDTRAVISRINFVDSSGVAYPSHLADAIYVGLNQYSVNRMPLPLTLAPGQTSQEFAQFELTVNSWDTQTSSGSWASVGGQNGNYAVDQFYPVTAGAFPGRFEVLPVFLDDSMFTEGFDVNSFPYTIFDANGAFESSNMPNGETTIQAVFGDFVHFNIAGVAGAPTFNAASAYAGKTVTDVYFSGDQIAISSGNTQGADFQILEPNNGYADGTVGAVNADTGNQMPINALTYNMVVPDPRDITGVARIPAGIGSLRDVSSVTTGLGAFEVMMIPQSGDGNTQTVVAFTKAAGQVSAVTNLYYGTADLNAKTVTLYPIADLTNGTTNGQISGTLSNLIGSGGSTTTTPSQAYFGSYNLNGSLPTGFTASGRFFVFRG